MKLNFPLPKPDLGFGTPSNLAGPNAPPIDPPWDEVPNNKKKTYEISVIFEIHLIAETEEIYD